MTFFCFFSFVHCTNFHHQIIEKGTVDIDLNGSSAYFMFQEGLDQNIEKLEFIFKNKSIKPRYGAAYSFVDNNLAIKNIGRDNISINFWKLPKGTCTSNIYMLSTNLQLSLSTKAPSFCLFSPYYLTAGGFSLLTEKNAVNGLNQVLYDNKNFFETIDDTKKVSATGPFVISKNKKIVSSFDAIITIINANKKTASNCEVVPFTVYGDDNSETWDAPSVQCTDLTVPPFSTALLILIFAIFFIALGYLLNKCGLIDVKKFVSSNETEGFGILSQTGTESVNNDQNEPLTNSMQN